MSTTYHLPLSVDDLANFEKQLVTAEIKIQEARLRVSNLKNETGNDAALVTALGAAATAVQAATDIVVTIV